MGMKSNGKMKEGKNFLPFISIFMRTIKGAWSGIAMMLACSVFMHKSTHLFSTIFLEVLPHAAAAAASGTEVFREKMYKFGNNHTLDKQHAVSLFC